MEKEITEEILHKYVNNSCTDAERIAVDSWYEAYEGMPLLFNDEANNEVRQWKNDVKEVVRAMVGGIEKNNERNLQEISVIQSWFLKATNT